MKFTILQSDLLPILQAVSRSVGVRSSLPVLGNILISTEDGRLKLAATNLEVGVIKFIPAEIIEVGDITIPAKTLVDIISGLPAVKVDIETVGEVMTISTGKFKATINGISASEFPVIPLSSEVGINFKREILEQTASILFAAAVDEGRPTLTGILTEVSAGKLELVATDGFRLAHRQVKLEEPKASFKSLIPRRTFEEVLRIISEETVEEVNISISDSQNQVIFKVGQTVISSRLIEGQFPVWDKIIPTEIKSRVIVDRQELLSAVKLASVFAKSESNIITIKLSGGTMSLESSTKELGSQRNEVDAQVEGEDLQIAFNVKFLLDAVSASNSTQLMIEFSGPLSPTLIKPVGVEGLEYIIMPVRI